MYNPCPDSWCRVLGTYPEDDKELHETAHEADALGRMYQ